MLESVVASFLSKLLGKYVENLNAERLRVNIGTSGNVELTNLKLRKEALIDTDLPFVVHRFEFLFTLFEYSSSLKSLSLSSIYILRQQQRTKVERLVRCV